MKKIKKSVAGLLCVLLIFSSISLVSFAKEEKPLPCLIIPGFSQCETNVFDENGNVIGDTATLAAPEIKSLLKYLTVPLLRSVIKRTDGEISKAVRDFILDWFKAYLIDNDGNSVYRREIKTYNLPYSKLSNEEREIIDSHVALSNLGEIDGVRYYYTYDDFASIKTAAVGLHDYIKDVVIRQTGAKKINIVPVSMGAAVLTMYLALYPEDYTLFNKIVPIVPAFDGSPIVGDILNDNVTIYDTDKLLNESIPNLCESLLGKRDTGYMISSILGLALPSSVLNTVLHSALEALKEAIVINTTTIWALCPHKDYVVARERYLKDGEHEKILAETELFDSARAKLPDTLKKLKGMGIEINIVASYANDVFLGDLLNCNGICTDGLINPESSTGATCVKLNEKLPVNYKSPQSATCTDKTHNHISPDRLLDASTCILPENTWFFKGVDHQTLNGREDIKAFAMKFVTDDSIKDIYSYPGFGQFNDPNDHVAFTESEDGFTLSFDQNGNFLFKTKEAQPKSSFSIWKIVFLFVKLTRRFCPVFS